MIDKERIETILKINGVSATSPDEEIRSVLLSARYNDNEVDTALMVLRENTKDNTTRVDGLHKVFRSDEGLKPEEITALLGIEVEVPEVKEVKLQQERSEAWLQTAVIVGIALILAIFGIMAAMYFYQVGIFHPTVSAFGK